MRRLVPLVSLCLGLAATCVATAQTPKVTSNSAGVLPVGKDGKPLNLDFETGTLRDWTATGEAFAGQPIKGDVVHKRRGDMSSRHQGEYWVGSYERRGDKPRGTLTSVPFKVTHPWASFLVSGGPHAETRVELVRADTKAVFFRASGLESENLRRVAVDLKDHLGKEMFVRVVDQHSGHWGHVNFDDFRFHARKPDLPPPPPGTTPDVYKYAGLEPAKAASVMTVPEGFEVKLFAGEPDVVQPIAMCLDERGRVWVAEGRCYPIRRNAKDANDRILIFEDTDGDGKFDKRTVFMEGLNLVSGLEVGFGGVWIGAAPYLMYVPMKDDRPAGKTQILLDGWAYQDTHETLNAFTWGPDGWLYGCHGVFTHSNVGKPGTPADKRTRINAGIWRYHPTRHVFEVFAHGTSNPWGLDFDDHGQAFIEACVIPHCFHIIQGGRYLRQAGQHFNRHTYADIQTIADHLHWQGANPWAGNNRSDSTGGGHAHCGLMCYLGGAWPAEYRGRLFMGNIHGRRINVDILRPKGSGYLAGHGPDFLHSNDAWSRFINMRYGPDGNVYLIDWYDKQACHHGDPKIWDRSNGRIYKICWRETKPVQTDLAKKTDRELAELTLHENDWYVRHARRLLQERAAAKTLDQDALRKVLVPILTNHRDATRRLRALWALHVTGLSNRDGTELFRATSDNDPFVRGWAVQLALEGERQLPLERLVEMAEKDRSPVVRRYLASALQRLTLIERQDILHNLLAWDEDASDPNLPLLEWYGLEPLAGNSAHRAKALEMASESKLPRLLEFTVRRIASEGTPESIELLVAELSKTAGAVEQLTFLRGISAALKGRRQVAMPKSWPTAFAKLAASKDAGVRRESAALAVTFGDAEAFQAMRLVLANVREPRETRETALAVLVSARDKSAVSIMHKLVADPELRGAALRGLATFDDARTAEVILAAYTRLNAAEKRDALGTLASRAAYGRELLAAVAAKKIASTDVSADLVRQLRNLNDETINRGLAKVWGLVRPSPAERVKLIAKYRQLITTATKDRPDPLLGRAIFAKTCAQCHTLFGSGGKVGPDITGANRADLNYLLENILDPSAVIQKEYAASVIELNNGRVVTGIVRAETPAALTVVTANESLTLPRDEVASRQTTPTSMMPDDLLKTFDVRQVRALIAYLQSPTQVPLLATPENAKDLFNGKDLTGWDGDPKLWRVEAGAIVGRTTGLKHNAFLRSHLVADDFRLSLEVKLVPDKENSGVQFRSEVLPGGDIKGYQADIGAGWWGKLYEEHGRGILWSKSGEPAVKLGEWNRYEIVADGSRIRTFINGKLCVDLDDPKGARRGVFALQLHSGGPMEVRFRNLRLEVTSPARRGS